MSHEGNCVTHINIHVNKSLSIYHAIWISVSKYVPCIVMAPVWLCVGTLSPISRLPAEYCRAVNDRRFDNK